MLTVILATHNGERTLPAVLEAYGCLETPAGGWKLVVVDNGSTDKTAEILHRFELCLPMTRLEVPSPGKNRALNAALAAREGDLVVFTDDDAVPAPDWLVQMRRAADCHREYDIFGGAIRPRWERPPETWHLNWVPPGVTYSITDPTFEDGPVLAEIAAWGPNMAIRAHMFDVGNRFDERIGPQKGVSYRMGSETEFTRRMERQGSRTWFVSTAVVEHIIRSYQMEKSWVLSRAIRFGRGMCYLERSQKLPQPAMLFGLPRYRVRRLGEHALRFAAAKLLSRKEAAFRESWALCCEWGYLLEARKGPKSRPAEASAGA